MTEPGRCRACRLWDNPNAADGAPWGACLLADSDAPGEACRPSGLATAAATAHTNGRLPTAPAFGCVRWERREADGGDP